MTRSEVSGVRYGTTVRHASGMLSRLATIVGETPAGTGTSMASAYGTRTTSEIAPPHPSPPIAPSPYADPRWTLVQSDVSPRAQRAHLPQETWNGTPTTSPTLTERTSSPTAITRPTNSCPSAYGRESGNSPMLIKVSRSQVATAIGSTSASSAPVRVGTGTSVHSALPGAVSTSCAIVSIACPHFMMVVIGLPGCTM